MLDHAELVHMLSICVFVHEPGADNFFAFGPKLPADFVGLGFLPCLAALALRRKLQSGAFPARHVDAVDVELGAAATAFIA